MSHVWLLPCTLPAHKTTNSYKKPILGRYSLSAYNPKKTTSLQNTYFPATWGGPYEKVLLDALMKNYNTQNRFLFNQEPTFKLRFSDRCWMRRVRLTSHLVWTSNNLSTWWESFQQIKVPTCLFPDWLQNLLKLLSSISRNGLWKTIRFIWNGQE